VNAAARWAQARRILCIRLDSVGDVLMSTPAIRALRESAPDRRISLLTSRVGALVAPLVPEIDDTLVFDAPWMKSTGDAPTADLAAIERLRAGRFDAAVVFTVYSQNPLPAAYLAYLAGVPLRLAHCRENPYQLLTDWVPETEPRQPARHEARRQLDLVATVGARARDERLSLAVPPAARERIAARLARLDAGAGHARSPRPLVLVHPGASAPSRRWPPEHFARAASMLAARGCAVVFTGSADEAPLVEAIRARMDAPSASLAGELDMAELAAAIALSDVLLVNNTGPAHMAAALGTPVVDLYALTNPQHTPWMVEARVLSHDVPCRDCYRSVCPQGHHDCLRRVAPETAVQAALELLAARGAAPRGDGAARARIAALPHER
jgi:lipopolysaccharide heptosyltransferase II